MHSSTTTASIRCRRCCGPSRRPFSTPLRASAARCSFSTVLSTPRASRSSLQIRLFTPNEASKPMLLLSRAAVAAASPSTPSSSSSASYLPARNPSDDPARLRVAVLTGWLGAGKTTTLTRWLEAAAAERSDGNEKEQKRAPPRVRLIINDVGASAVDAAMLSKAEIVPPASLVALTAGCACCSLQAELVEAVAAAAADAREFVASSSSSSSSASALLPDSWLFIECTGLALPSPVANAVAEGVRRAGGIESKEEDEEEESSLEAVVAVVDVSTFAAGLAGAFDVTDDEDKDEEFEDGDFEEELEEEGEVDEQGQPLNERFAPRDFAEDEGPFEELAGVASPEGSVADLLASQVEAADVVLLNKADAVSLETLEEARALVAALNPGAKIVEAVRGDVPPSSLLGEGAAAAVASDGEGEGKNRRRRRGVSGWAAALAAAAAARGKSSSGDGETETKKEGGAHSHSHSHSHDEEEEGGHHHHHHGDDDLHPSAHGISSFVFHSKRPFHPRRLLEALELEDDGGSGSGGESGDENDKSNSGSNGGPWKGVVRSKGFFWLATRPKVAGLWQAAGGSWVGDPSHLWEKSESGEEGEEAPSSSSSSSSSTPPQQELVFIGNRSMSEASVRQALENALLTDEEMRGGEESWSRFEDELPPWE